MDTHNPEHTYLEELTQAHKRRLERLEIQKARKGYNTEPEVLNEIEDINAILIKLTSKVTEATSNLSSDNSLTQEEQTRILKAIINPDYGILRLVEKITSYVMDFDDNNHEVHQGLIDSIKLQSTSFNAQIIQSIENLSKNSEKLRSNQKIFKIQIAAIVLFLILGVNLFSPLQTLILVSIITLVAFSLPKLYKIAVHR